MGRAARGLRQRLSSIGDVMRARDLRRLELAWACFSFEDALSVVALSVWAFREGGTPAVGAIALARLLPGALALPAGAWAADRFSRSRVVRVVLAAIVTVDVAVAGALANGAGPAVVLSLVAVGSVVAAPYRPAHFSLAPLVARSPEELIAINVTSGTLEGIVTFVGPAIAGLLLIVADSSLVMLVSALAALCGLGSALRIAMPADPSRSLRGTHEGPLRALLGGFMELRGNCDMAVVVGCFVTQILVRGFLGVLLVTVSFELTGLGSSGVGWLVSAMGVGATIGGLAAAKLTTRRRLGTPVLVALALWGAPIAVIGLLPHAPVALAAMLGVGLGNAVLDVAGFTLIQRLGRDQTLGRVFGVLFTVGVAMGGIGAAVTPALISWLGVRTALVMVGAILPVLALVLTARFRSIDARSEPLPELLGLVTGVPLLSPLPPTMLEKLASRATVIEYPAGEVVVAERERGESFYVVAFGEVEVSRAGVSRRTLIAGDHFGEIALLRTMPRTATVTTTRPSRLLVLSGRDFVDALSTSDVAFAMGGRAANELLAGDAVASSTPPTAADPGT